MKRITYAKSIALSSRTLPINTTKKSGCYIEILQASNSQMEAMLSHHSKILVVRLDVHVNYYSPNSKVISDFLRKAKKIISREYRGKYGDQRIAHIWVREKSKSTSQHYHLALILNGNVVRSGEHIANICARIWQGWEQPAPYKPDNKTYLIRRDDDEAFAKAFYRLSYLAKEATKGNRGKTANDYSASRIRFKQAPAAKEPHECNASDVGRAWNPSIKSNKTPNFPNDFDQVRK